MKKSKFLLKPIVHLSILTLCGCFFLYFVYPSKKVDLPSPAHPQKLYISPSQSNLRTVFLRAIRSATHSIYLTTFNLRDPHIMHAIRAASRNGIDIRILTDYRGQEHLLTAFDDTIDVAFGHESGLMHEKILVIDAKTVFISTANMTASSLVLHENMCIGLYNPSLAKEITTEKEGVLQNIFYRKVPVSNFCTFIENAKHSITGFIFTYTNHEIHAAFKKQFNKGVSLRLFYDHGKIPEGIPAQKAPYGPLFHHKCLLIDSDTLLIGSANWTKAAFSRNRDCFIAIKLTNKNKILLDNYINYCHCVIP